MDFKTDFDFRFLLQSLQSVGERLALQAKMCSEKASSFDSLSSVYTAVPLKGVPPPVPGSAVFL